VGGRTVRARVLGLASTKAQQNGAGGGGQAVTLALARPDGWVPGTPVTAAIETNPAAGVWIRGFAGELVTGTPLTAAASAAGTLVAVGVREGQHVQAGQIVAELRSFDLEQAVATALGNLQQAQQALRTLQVNQAATAQSAAFAIAQQRIKVRELAEQVAADRAVAAGMVVRSPVSGVISSVPAVAGEPVGPGTPLMTIGDYSKLLVDFPLDQLYVDEVHVGEPATVTSTADPGKTFPGSLYLIAPEGTNVNGVATFPAEVLIPQPTPALRPGMAVQVAIVLGVRHGALTVPLQALRTTASGHNYVLVVTHSTAGVHVQRVTVRVLLENDLVAAVQGHLRPGDQVLTASRSALGKASGLNVRGRVLRRPPVRRAAPARAARRA